MEKKKIIIGVVVVVLVGLFVFELEISGKTIFDRLFKKQAESGGGGGVWEPIDLNEENFGNFLASINLVHELPEEGVILLSLYNFDIGERQFTKKYLLEKAKVSLVNGGGGDVDLEINIHSKYVSIIGQKGFCYGVQSAKNNGDVSFENKISSAGFLWKYKSMMKYKECFGF
tara:strand:+ start:1023 stop:1538 length:516 start_codon:yes stop_codon:yes gene_type:complete